MTKRISYAFIGLAAIIFLLIGYLLADWLHFLSTPIFYGERHVVFTVAPGTPFGQVAAKLKAAKLIRNERYLIILGYLNNVSKSLKAGEYRLDSAMTPYDLLQVMVDGKVIQHELTLLEGWTLADIVTAIKANTVIKQTLDLKHPATILAQLGINSIHPEGLFLPETYHFPRGTTDADILLRAYNSMQKVLQNAWQQRDISVPYKTPYQALIAASLIEKETALAFERPIVASVICNRLQKGMRLQIDPTLIYALGDNYKGKLHHTDLKLASPYNTYHIHGLPPTPIALPSESALKAALSPKDTDYLYYVAKGDGSHQFSVNYTEQLAAIAKYRKSAAVNTKKNN